MPPVDRMLPYGTGSRLRVRGLPLGRRPKLQDFAEKRLQFLVLTDSEFGFSDEKMKKPITIKTENAQWNVSRTSARIGPHVAHLAHLRSLALSAPLRSFLLIVF